MNVPHPDVAPFTKLCGFLLLHELAHAALRKRDGDADEKEGERFNAEIKRLKDAGAYDNLYCCPRISANFTIRSFATSARSFLTTPILVSSSSVAQLGL